MRRYPLEPLLTLTRVTPERLSVDAGFNESTVRQARKRGGLTAATADRLAVAAGFHPAQVWPSWLDDEFAECSVACGECGERFVPARVTNVYCTVKCKNRRSSREYRRRNPEWNRQQRAAYYAENGDYERARQRRYDAARRAAERAA